MTHWTGTERERSGHLHRDQDRKTEVREKGGWVYCEKDNLRKTVLVKV